MHKEFAFLNQKYTECYTKIKIKCCTCTHWAP